MDILVCGAGVIGTLYAARLQGAGNQVTILARGRRLEEIRRHGLVLDNVLTGVRTATQVGAVERLDSNIRYDIALALVIVRRAQLVRLGAQL